MNINHERYFIDAINSRDIEKIKNAICLYIDKDAADSNNQIKSAIRELDLKGINIWQDHQEIEPIKEKSQWNRDYIGLLQSDLMYNFSKERLNLILKVGKHVYGERKSNVSIIKSGGSNNRNNSHQKHTNNDKSDITDHGYSEKLNDMKAQPHEVKNKYNIKKFLSTFLPRKEK